MTSQNDQRDGGEGQFTLARKVLGALPTMRDDQRTLQADADLR